MNRIGLIPNIIKYKQSQMRHRIQMNDDICFSRLLNHQHKQRKTGKSWQGKPSRPTRGSVWPLAYFHVPSLCEAAHKLQDRPFCAHFPRRQTMYRYQDGHRGAIHWQLEHLNDQTIPMIQSRLDTKIETWFCQSRFPSYDQTCWLVSKKTFNRHFFQGGGDGGGITD